MSVTSQNNIMDVFVVKNAAPTTYSSITNIFDTVTGGLADGEIGVVGYNATSGKEEKLVTANAGSLATYPYIRLVQRLGSELFYGSKIYAKNITKVTQKANVAFAEQVYFVGFNGSSGSLDVSQSNEFILTIAYDHDDMMWSEQKLRNSYDYYSQSPTQSGLAFSMVSQINYKENLASVNGTGKMVLAEAVSSGSFLASSAGSFTVTNGSNTITVVESAGGANDAGKYNSDAGTFAIGDTIRLGGTGNTTAVYLITGVSGAGTASCTITLSQPYQGTSGTVTAANAGYISGGNYGIKISGQPLTWTKDFFKYNKVKFHLDIKGFGNSTYDRPGSIGPNSAESTKGIGYYQEVAEWESFAAGNQGALNRMVVPLPTGRNMTLGTNTSSVTYYNTWVIEQADTQLTSNSAAIAGVSPMRIQTVLFFPDGTNGDAAQGSAAATAGLIGTSTYKLEAWFNAAGFTIAQTT